MSRSPIFVGGAGRSGTTLLRVILDSHPNITCGPELKVTPSICRLWQDFQTAYAPPLREYDLTPADVNDIFARTLVSLLEKHRLKTGKPRVAEKSPNNVFFFEHLNLLFPDSPLVHVIRDGRDVVSSLLTMNWVSPKTGRPLEYTRDVGKAAAYWSNAVKAGVTAARLRPGVARQYFEIRYEAIVMEAEATLKGLFEFLGEPWDPVVLRFHEQRRNLASESSAAQVSQSLYSSAAGRWRRDLSAEQQNIVKETVGDLLVELGYAADRNW